MMKVEVAKYRKANGYITRFWSVTVDGELLAVTLYRKGAEAVAMTINNLNQDPYVSTLQDSPRTYNAPSKPSASVAS